jgi:UDP-N-acetylglucosamine 2-epimerase (non-hydrolysing)
MIKVLEVAGARPNYMKVAPIHRAMLAAGGFEPLFVHTGQHYDWEMSKVFMQDLGLPAPDVELGVGSGSQAEQTAQVMLRMEPVLLEHRPDVVLVVGDVNSTLGATLAAVKLLVPVAHVEAGLRSFDRTMPEEINRVLTDVVSELLFAPSSDAVANLVAEGIAPDRIHLVGNVMIDSLDALFPRAQGSDVLDRLGVDPGGYFVATLHRPSNVDGDAALRQVVDVLSLAAASLPVLLVAHPRTRKRLSHAGLSHRVTSDGIRLVEPLGYIDFLCLMSRAAGVLTDSGGIQEETTVLGVPCLTLRDRTERPVTVSEGTNEVVGLDGARIGEAVRRLADGDAGAGGRRPRPELWDGCAATRIVEILRDRFA